MGAATNIGQRRDHLVGRRADGWLDRRLGYYPLALRLNRRHGFHAERMAPGHPNWMLDTERLADVGRVRLAWLNLGLSLLAGFTAVALGHWLGGAL